MQSIHVFFRPTDERPFDPMSPQRFGFIVRVMKIPQDGPATRLEQPIDIIHQEQDKFIAEVVVQADAVDEVLCRHIDSLSAGLQADPVAGHPFEILSRTFDRHPLRQATDLRADPQRCSDPSLSRSWRRLESFQLVRGHAAV